MSLFKIFNLFQFFSPLVGFFWFVPGFVEVDQIIQRLLRVRVSVTEFEAAAFECNCIGPVVIDLLPRRMVCRRLYGVPEQNTFLSIVLGFMPDNLAIDHINDVLCYVRRMVSDTLQMPRNTQQMNQ